MERTTWRLPILVSLEIRQAEFRPRGRPADDARKVAAALACPFAKLELACGAKQSRLRIAREFGVEAKDDADCERSVRRAEKEGLAVIAASFAKPMRLFFNGSAAGQTPCALAFGEDALEVDGATLRIQGPAWLWRPWDRSAAYREVRLVAEGQFDPSIKAAG